LDATLESPKDTEGANRKVNLSGIRQSTGYNHLCSVPISGGNYIRSIVLYLLICIVEDPCTIIAVHRFKYWYSCCY